MYKGMKRIVACLLALPLLVFALPALAEDEPPRIPPGDLAPAGAALSGEGKYDVYTGPGEDYLRPAEGKATVSAKGWVLSFGVEKGWTLITYQLATYQYRFGWIKGRVVSKELAFERVPAVLHTDTPLTDDPLGKQGVLASLEKGAPVTRLAKMGIWAYVEAEIDGVKARGFVLKESLQYADTAIQYEDCLYPIRVDGNWGYMNYQGETVLAPQWASAGEFRGAGYAEVGTDPDWWTTKNEYSFGIIDRTGAYAVAPEYSCDEGYDGSYYAGKDTGIIWMTSKDHLGGFFDVASGCFSGTVYDPEYCRLGSSRLLTVLAPGDGYGWWNGLGFADRTTGKLAIPYQYGLWGGVSEFVSGYAYVERYPSETSEPERLIINESNEAFPLPKGIVSLGYTSFVEGYLVVIDTETGLYGFVDTSGKLVIPAKYEYADSFDNSIAKVDIGGETRYIDTAGRFVQAPEDDESLQEGIHGDDWPLFFGPSQTDAWRPCGLLGGNGDVLVPLDAGYRFDMSYIFGCFDYFTEGLQVLMKDEKYGFLDEKGNELIPFVWDYAENFSNGLAYVEKGGKMAYIDHSGNIVWQEK